MDLVTTNTCFKILIYLGFWDTFYRSGSQPFLIHSSFHVFETFNSSLLKIK